MTEAVLMLAAVLQRFELRPGEPAGKFPQADPKITLRPQSVVVSLKTR